MKFPWWRAKGIVGKLQIDGRRLDAVAPKIRVETNDDQTEGFQPVAIIFPTEGCWQITASVGSESLTVVQYVTTAGA